MAKSDRDHALQLLEMASKDQIASANMLDRQGFSEEVFGFHTQQAVEKALKAWLAALHCAYPKTHDVSVLVRTLRDAGADLAKFADLEDYTVFAVQYRYEAFDPNEAPLDRKKVAGETATLLSHVRNIIDRSLT
jgi:HEPN domain-containing protein